MSAITRQIGGTHYTSMSVQPWEVIRQELGDELFAAYLLGTITQYRMRDGKKPGTDDLAKAKHCNEMLEEVLSGMGLAGSLIVARRNRLMRRLREMNV